MKILLCSVPFHPSVGGIETVSEILAEQFRLLGHEVRVVTRSAHDRPDEAAYEIVRRPSAGQLLRAIAHADVVFHNNISLRFAWPQLFARRKPWVIAHHVWTPDSGAGRLKRAVMRVAHNTAVSEAIASALPVPAKRVPNPYADDLFVAHPEAARERDIVFLGRLVSDKGPALLLEALGQLRTRGATPTLTFIGSGPEQASLQERTAALGLATQIHFAGARQGDELVELLNGHRIMVVPSVWEEPFGIVVLEGIACGLVPIVARSGGLPEAVGRCGLIVPKSDPAALADAIAGLLGNAELRATLASHAPAHLARHTRRAVALAYLEVLECSLDQARARHA